MHALTRKLWNICFLKKEKKKGLIQHRRQIVREKKKKEKKNSTELGILKFDAAGTNVREKNEESFRARARLLF